MQPSELQAWLARRGWSAYRLARTLGRHQTTIANWLSETTSIPPELPPALCWLEYRDLVQAGLGTAVCPRCGGLAREDDDQDDRYGCVLCGARIEP